MRSLLMSGVVLLLLAGGCLAGTGRPEPPPPKDVAVVSDPVFVTDIQPILRDFCEKCHSRFDAHAGLRLDSFEQLRQGGREGPMITPGKPEESILLLVIKYQIEPFMPYHGAMLTPNRITNIERWIQQGARNGPE